MSYYTNSNLYAVEYYTNQILYAVLYCTDPYIFIKQVSGTGPPEILVNCPLCHTPLTASRYDYSNKFFFNSILKIFFFTENSPTFNALYIFHFLTHIYLLYFFISFFLCFFFKLFFLLNFLLFCSINSNTGPQQMRDIGRGRS